MHSATACVAEVGDIPRKLRECYEKGWKTYARYVESLPKVSITVRNLHYVPTLRSDDKVVFKADKATAVIIGFPPGGAR